MRKIMYNWVLYVCVKNVNSSHFHDVTDKEVFDSQSKENRFMVYKKAEQKMLNFLTIVLYTRKLKLLLLSYSAVKLDDVPKYAARNVKCSHLIMCKHRISLEENIFYKHIINTVT